MSEYSGFILVNRNTLGQCMFDGCHIMSENSVVGLHKFHCICIIQNITHKNVPVSNLIERKSLCIHIKSHTK